MVKVQWGAGRVGMAGHTEGMILIWEELVWMLLQLW